MVTANHPVIVLEKDGTKMILTLNEAKEVKQHLDSFLNQHKVTTGPDPTLNQHNSSSPKVHMSPHKCDAIIEHVVDKLTNEPQSLTQLLKGIPFVPNYQPVIKEMIENDSRIAIHKSGRRIFYSKK